MPRLKPGTPTLEDLKAIARRLKINQNAQNLQLESTEQL